MRLRLAALAAVLLSAASAFGQGCAMCYMSAQGADQRGQMALSHAVLVLMIPTLGVIAGFTGITVHFRDSHLREDEPGEQPGDEEL